MNTSLIIIIITMNNLFIALLLLEMERPIRPVNPSFC